MADRIVIDGASLTCAQVALVGRGEASVEVAPAAVAAAGTAWQVEREVAAARPVYGWTTGVGANRTVPVAAAEAAQHGLNLLRSHAAGAGPLLEPDLARAMLVVRLNQIGAGGSGVDPGVLHVLADAINRGFVPPVPRYGAIGTGDLTALAATGLCLLGERDWLLGSGPPPRFALRPAEVLGFQSSSAATLGEAALACADLARLSRAAVPIAALSLLAVRGSAEPFAGRGAAGPAASRPAAGGRGRPRADPGAARPPGPAAGPVRLPGVPAGARPGAGRGGVRVPRGHRGHQRGQREPAG